ncbi:PKD domain-containing protein [Thalassiella azotivora]
MEYWLYSAPAGTAFGDDGWTRYATRCLAPTDPTGTDAAPVMTLEDFQRLPLPAGQPNVQPPNGYTLINIETNVYARAEPTTLDTTLLGIPVQVRATPVAFHWDFGDGQTFGPHADAGDPYPALRITNTYAEPGTYDITLTTHYTGEYSVAGGPFLPIPGQAQVTSAPVQVEALAGRNQLVADTLP